MDLDMEDDKQNFWRTQPVIVEYDSNWPLRYEDEKKLLVPIFGERLLAMHHMGSTSVPGTHCLVFDYSILLINQAWLASPLWM
jgi:GrpB-like predicted nucleotidyltransferase (UPF0157 family)